MLEINCVISTHFKTHAHKNPILRLAFQRKEQKKYQVLLDFCLGNEKTTIFTVITMDFMNIK